MKKKVIILIDEPSPSLDVAEILRFISGFGFPVENKGDLLSFLDLNEKNIRDFDRFLSSIEVNDIEIPVDYLQRAASKVRQEKTKGISSRIPGASKKLIDGIWFQRWLYGRLASKLPEMLDESAVVVVITGKLFGTFSEYRYHARVVLLGVPNLVSTSGVVEAPARPPEYYWIKAGFIQSGRDISQIDEIYGDRYLVYDDKRLTDIMCSYVLQPLVYSISGKAFCDDSRCCLYNSHWQKEVLELQLSKKLCPKCYEILTK